MNSWSPGGPGRPPLPPEQVRRPYTIRLDAIDRARVAASAVRHGDLFCVAIRRLVSTALEGEELLIWSECAAEQGDEDR
jgi:hypothetical protein